MKNEPCPEPGRVEDDRRSTVAAPPPRTFTFNSREFYEAVTPPPDPWLWGPGLPSEPRVWEPAVIVERRERGK